MLDRNPFHFSSVSLYLMTLLYLNLNCVEGEINYGYNNIMCLRRFFRGGGVDKRNLFFALQTHLRVFCIFTFLSGFPLSTPITRHRDAYVRFSWQLFFHMLLPRVDRFPFNSYGAFFSDASGFPNSLVAVAFNYMCDMVGRGVDHPHQVKRAEKNLTVHTRKLLKLPLVHDRAEELFQPIQLVGS